MPLACGSIEYNGTTYQYVKQHHKWPPTWTELPNKYRPDGFAADVNTRSPELRRIMPKYRVTRHDTTELRTGRKGSSKHNVLAAEPARDWDAAAGAVAPAGGWGVGGSLCTDLIVLLSDRLTTGAAQWRFGTVPKVLPSQLRTHNAFSSLLIGGWNRHGFTTACVMSSICLKTTVLHFLPPLRSAEKAKQIRNRQPI